VLGNPTERQTRLLSKDTTANLTEFYTLLNHCQLQKTRLSKTLDSQKQISLKYNFAH